MCTPLLQIRHDIDQFNWLLHNGYYNEYRPGTSSRTNEAAETEEGKESGEAGWAGLMGGEEWRRWLRHTVIPAYEAVLTDAIDPLGDIGDNNVIGMNEIPHGLRKLAESPQPAGRHHRLQVPTAAGFLRACGRRKTYFRALITSRSPSRAFAEQPARNFASKVFTKLRISARCPCVSRK